MRPLPILPTAAALAVAALLTAGPRPVLSQAVQLVVVDVQTVEQGYRTSKLKGTSVVNDQNEKIGTLDDIIIGRDGNALFAVLQVGGFLGLGGHLVAIPYKSLDVSDDGRKIVLPGATKEALKNLPEFKYA